jgi:hypothetical protein
MFAMASSGPELDLDFLTKRKDNVEVPQGIDTPMCFCGDSCKLVRCKVLGYACGMRFFMLTMRTTRSSHSTVTLEPK